MSCVQYFSVSKIFFPSVFLQLKDNATVQQAEQQLRAINKKYLADWSVSLKRDGAIPNKKGDVFSTHLLSLNDLHFSPRINNVGNSVNKAELVAMLAISLLIILIACFNFVNTNLFLSSLCCKYC